MDKIHQYSDLPVWGGVWLTSVSVAIAALATMIGVFAIFGTIYGWRKYKSLEEWREGMDERVQQIARKTTQEEMKKSPLTPNLTKINLGWSKRGPEKNDNGEENV